MRWIVPLLMLCAQGNAAVFGTLTPAAHYYVDKVAGLDANAGTLAAPFQTIAKLQSVLTTGQLGAIYGGPVGGTAYRYQEQLTLTPANIGIKGYGATPLLDCSSPISTGAWTKTGGFTNIYQATLTTDNQLTALLRIWENDVSFVQVASLATLDTTASAYFYTGTGTTYTMYVHASDNGNPASNGKTYEYNPRSNGVFSSLAATVSNIRTRRNLANNGSFEIGPFSLATDITADDGTKHNALIHKGSTYRNITMHNSYYAGQAKIALVVNDNQPNGEDVYIENAQYIETLELTGVGFFGHVNTGGLFGLITLKNCGTVGAVTSVSGFAAAGMLVDGGIFNAGIIMGGGSIVRNITTTGALNIPYGGLIEIENVVSSGNFTNGNVVVGAGFVPSLYIHNSDFTNTKAFDGAIYISTGVTPSAFVLQNNIFRAPVQTNHIGGPGAANIPVGATITGNTYHYPAAATWINYRGTAYNIQSTGWASWQALGFDASGSRVTP